MPVHILNTHKQCVPYTFPLPVRWFLCCHFLQRNYRTFLLFIFTATVLCLYVVGVCLAQLFLRHKELVNEDKAAGGTGDGK